jgi:hypothetical protein
MPELLEITQLILKHLPPSADRPRVRPLDDRSRRWCLALDRARDVQLIAESDCDAVVASDIVLVQNATSILRPNGRAIFLVPNTEQVALETLIEALTSAGLVRILAEPVLGDAFLLARGECPTEHQRPTDRIAAIAQLEASPIVIADLLEIVGRYPHLHLLVEQQPPSRGWDDKPPGAIWHALTVRDVQSNQIVLPVFTSLPKAVAFMQPAILAGAIKTINKLPRFESDRLLEWRKSIIVNPTFAALREDPRFDFNSPPLEVDPLQALKSNE